MRKQYRGILLALLFITILTGCFKDKTVDFIRTETSVISNESNHSTLETEGKEQEPKQQEPKQLEEPKVQKQDDTIKYDDQTELPKIVANSLKETPKKVQEVLPVTVSEEVEKEVEKQVAVPIQNAPTVKISIHDQNKEILGEVEIPWQQDLTAFELLKKITQSQNIQMDFRGEGENAYISGIDNKYEFDKGPESGWMYKVNGIFPNVSCGAYKLKIGDVITWEYTSHLGNDLK